jgi:hypothetical protein
MEEKTLLIVKKAIEVFNGLSEAVFLTIFRYSDITGI